MDTKFRVSRNSIFLSITSRKIDLVNSETIDGQTLLTVTKSFLHLWTELIPLTVN